MKNKLFLIFLLACLILTSGFGLKACKSRAKRQGYKAITLDYWRVWDGPDDFQKILAKYKKIHPNIKINYRKLRYEEYEQELLEAFATDRGPDIFSLHNTWIKKYQSKGLLQAMPASITMFYPQLEGAIKKEVVYNQKTVKSLSASDLKNKFIDAIYHDAVIPVKNEKTGRTENRIFALPLSVDTLAMYYNRDLFNNAGITSAPNYWNREFQQDVKKLTKQNNKGQIVQSGVAMGGSDNIERSVDILSVLMMQGGAELMDPSGRVKFNLTPEDLRDKNYNPGMDALRFYSDFSNPAKEVYCWNNELENSLDMFVQGKLGMMFGYSYMLPDIKSRAPKLNFNISPLPQIEGNPSVNFANYWAEVVSSNSEDADAAWDFLQFATKAEQAKTYLEATDKPPALRSLVDEMAGNPETGVFTSQLLTAKSWYRGVEPLAAEEIMREMIDKAASGQAELEDIINTGAKKIQQTIN